MHSNRMKSQLLVALEERAKEYVDRIQGLTSQISDLSRQLQDVVDSSLKWDGLYRSICREDGVEPDEDLIREVVETRPGKSGRARVTRRSSSDPTGTIRVLVKTLEDKGPQTVEDLMIPVRNAGNNVVRASLIASLNRRKDLFVKDFDGLWSLTSAPS